MTRRVRTRLARNIYADAYGIAAVARAGKLCRELRFPANTPLEEIQSALERARANLRDDATAGAARPTERTLARAVIAYLKLRRGRPGAAADRSHLKAWIALYPKESPNRLTPAHVARAIAGWREHDVAPQTIRHRCRALRQLLGQTRTARVFAGVDLPKVPAPMPRTVPAATVRRVLKALKTGDAKTYARFLVRWTTGQRPVDLMRAEPADLDLRRRVWRVRAAKGGDPHPIILTDAAVRAWRLFIKADAWGSFDTTQHARWLRAAGWPDGVRPYELRHTLAITILEADGDLGDVQAALGHRSIETTRRFYAQASLTRARRVAEALKGKHRW